MNKKEKIIRIIRYIISIFIYLMALACFANKWLLSGIILVLSGTILLPILDDLLKFKHKRLIEVLATIILFILGMAITPASQEWYNNTISDNTLNVNEIYNSTKEISNETNSVESYIENNTLENNEENTIEKTNNNDSQSTSTSNSNIKSTENNNQSQSKTQSETQTQAQAQATITSQPEQQQTKTESTQSQTTTSSSEQKSSAPASSQQSKSTKTDSNTNNSHGRTIYGTPTGKKYHYDPDCAGKNAQVITSTTGLEPCKKCVVGH